MFLMPQLTSEPVLLHKHSCINTYFKYIAVGNRVPTKYMQLTWNSRLHVRDSLKYALPGTDVMLSFRH